MILRHILLTTLVKNIPQDSDLSLKWSKAHRDWNREKKLNLSKVPICRINSIRWQNFRCHCKRNLDGYISRWNCFSPFCIYRDSYSPCDDGSPSFLPPRALWNEFEISLDESVVPLVLKLYNVSLTVKSWCTLPPLIPMGLTLSNWRQCRQWEDAYFPLERKERSPFFLLSKSA